jgi:hypothetical protein
MGKDSPSPPPAPDYAGAAAAQGAANLETAKAQGRMNNPNVVGPLGSQTVTWGTPTFDQAGYDKAIAAYSGQPQRGAAPDISNYSTRSSNDDGPTTTNVDQAGYSKAMTDWTNSGVAGPAPTKEQFTSVTNPDQPTVTQTLTPNAQATLDAQQQVQKALANLGVQGIGTAQNVLSSAFNPNLPNLQTSLDTSGVAKMPVNAGMTGQAAIMSRLAPQLEKSDAATRQRLINQGLVPGGEAYENAMISQNQQKNDLLTQAALQGIGLDTAANAQGYNQALQSGQFGNTAAQQSLQQQLALRNQPLNEIAGLMSGSQIQMPQFQGYQGSNIAPAPIMQGAQAAGQSAMDQYGIASSNVNAQNAGLYGLLGAGGAAGIMKYSDPRLKSNVVRVGTHPLGIGVYEYDIFGNRERGVMADEVEAVMPEAVALHPSGYKMVNYGMIN